VEVLLESLAHVPITEDLKNLPVSFEEFVVVELVNAPVRKNFQYSLLGCQVNYSSRVMDLSENEYWKFFLTGAFTNSTTTNSSNETGRFFRSSVIGTCAKLSRSTSTWSGSYFTI
jgi:hypothetical protein